MCDESLKNCGLPIADCGLDLGSLIQNPKSEVRNRLRRSAISLTEVLIALGILTIGLLGVASVFPVGSWYMQKAAVADQGSAIAQSVMNEAVTRGLLNPGTWYVMTPAPPSGNVGTGTLGKWNTNFPSDGKYCPNQSATSWTFTRPFAATLSEAVSQPTASLDSALIPLQMGNAFVIDPMGVAALAMPNFPNGVSNPYAKPFPLSVQQFGDLTTMYSAEWRPWGTNPSETWPIRRVTIQQSNGWQMNPALASVVCGGTDDLATELPKRDDRPAMQNWDVYRGSPMARQWAGDFSWMMTVLPSTPAAISGMATNPEAFEYLVSVVVFHKRVLPSSLPANQTEAKNNGAVERAVRASVVTTGPNGGELLLEAIPSTIDSISENAFSHLKAGQWIMLCGPHPNSNAYLESGVWKGTPRFVMNWYQVLSIDKDAAGLNPTTQRLVAVRGSQWPWIPSTASSNLSNHLCVAICKGAVAVHTKTIRLENPKGGSFGSGSSLITPPGVTDPRVGIH